MGEAGETPWDNLSETPAVNCRKGDLIGRTNVLLASLHDAPCKIILEAFQKQVCHMYGVQAWDLSDNGTKAFHTMWNRCARRVLGLPAQTHTRYASSLENGPLQCTSLQKDNKVWSAPPMCACLRYGTDAGFNHTYVRDMFHCVSSYLANNGLNEEYHRLLKYQ